MTFLAHGILTYLILSDISQFPLEVSLPIAVAATLPDVIGFAEKIYKKDKKVWNWYKWAHNPKNIFGILTGWVITHTIIDIALHDENGKWTKLAWFFEITVWLILVLKIISEVV